MSDLETKRDAQLAALENKQGELSADLFSANRELSEGQEIGLDPASLDQLSKSIEAVDGLEMLYPEPLWQYSTDESEAFRMQIADIEAHMKRIETGQTSLAEARKDLARYKIDSTG